MRDYSKQSFVNLTKIKLRSNISEVEDQKKIIIKLILPSIIFKKSGRETIPSRVL